jgi:hypothetical protein
MYAQSGHEHTLCYNICSSTNNLYVPRCLILRVNFGGGNPTLLRYVPLEDIARRTVTVPCVCHLRKRRVSSREDASLSRSRPELALDCAKSVLPVAVLRFKSSVNRRVKFSDFVGLPTQRI